MVIEVQSQGRHCSDEEHAELVRSLVCRLSVIERRIQEVQDADNQKEACKKEMCVSEKD